MTTPHTIRERLRAEVTDAMRQRDRVALSAYRQALAAIDNAGAVVPDGGVPSAGALEDSAIGVGAAEVDRRDLSDDDIRAVLRSEVLEHRNAAIVVAEHDASRADGHQRAADLLERVLA